MNLLSSAITIGMFSAALGVILAILPSSPLLPDEFLTAISSIVGYIEPWSYLVNFSAMLSVALIITGFELLSFSIRLGIWIMDEIFNRA